MEHKAFVFEFADFESELRVVLERALETRALEELSRFIDENLASLTDPSEGEPLDDRWRGMVEVVDPHQYGDFALTKYYGPREDVGFGYDWERVQEKLLRDLGHDAPLLGNTVGPAGNVFDPGKMGSYFQSSAQVATNLEALRRLSRSEAPDVDVERLRRILESAVGRGLYVTF